MTVKGKAELLEKVERRKELTIKELQGIPKYGEVYARLIGEISGIDRVRQIIEEMPSEQAHLIPLNDIANHDVVYVEDCTSSNFTYPAFPKVYASRGDIYGFYLISRAYGDKRYLCGEYNRSIRCWSSKPTKEQMEAVVWGEEREYVVPHKLYKNLSHYWCECGWYLEEKNSTEYCPNCKKPIAWEGCE